MLSRFCLLCIVVYVTISLCYQSTDAILCYQCADLQGQNQCQSNYSVLANTSLLLTKQFFQNCTQSNPAWDRCMIERKWIDNESVIFHRGCHDGKTFIDLFESPRFHNLTANNLTTCAQVKEKTFVCYQFCNAYDFCNGPLKPEPCNETLTDLDDGPVCAAQGLHHQTGTHVQNLACLVGLLLAVIGRL